jgi:hypothetical protein
MSCKITVHRPDDHVAHVHTNCVKNVKRSRLEGTKELGIGGDDPWGSSRTGRWGGAGGEMVLQRKCPGASEVAHQVQAMKCSSMKELCNPPSFVFFFVYH